MELVSKTAHELRHLLDRGEVSSVEVTQAFLQRIEAVDGKIGAFLLTLPELALEMAAQADERRGVPGVRDQLGRGFVDPAIMIRRRHFPFLPIDVPAPQRRWRPHSLCSGSSHHQRPERGCSPGATARVQGAQPMER